MKDYCTLDDIRFEWLGQSTVRMTTAAGFTVYTDPVLLDDDPPRADLILITHHHVDHCLPEYVSRIRDDETWLAAFHDSYVKHCAEDIKGKRVRAVKIGQTVTIAGVRITGVEAYAPRGFHSRGEGCGFIMEIEGKRVYVAGDTAMTEEMAGLGEVDVAILPITDNTYTIKLEEMAEAARVIDPALLIPVHYTPADEPDPAPPEGILSTKDVRFFTSKEDPARLLPLVESTDIEVAILKKLTPPVED